MCFVILGAFENYICFVIALAVSNEEVECLWQQFKELGCNEDGEISGKTLMAASESNKTMTSRVNEGEILSYYTSVL